NCRRKYVNLYKIKLKCLQQDQDYMTLASNHVSPNEKNKTENSRMYGKRLVENFSRWEINLTSMMMTMKWLPWTLESSPGFSPISNEHKVAWGIMRLWMYSEFTLLAFENKVIDVDVLQMLEEIEKKSEVNDILSYRSTAERELQDILLNSSSSNVSNIVNTVKPLEDEHISSKPRGWLNWLSRGMLGAGGTDDSSQFSGVISDDVVKDIYEATKFQPVLSVNDDTPADNQIYFSSLKFNIKEVSASIRSMKLGYAIANMVLEGISVGCETWEEGAVIIAEINSAEMLNPFNKQVVLRTRYENAEDYYIIDRDHHVMCMMHIGRSSLWRGYLVHKKFHLVVGVAYRDELN
ncbi:hypothetical protein HAX54_048745, partial [Datura stramonium]|nr:hypothetical protein [Datura stramonium]